MRHMVLYTKIVVFENPNWTFLQKVSQYKIISSKSSFHLSFFCWAHGYRDTGRYHLNNIKYKKNINKYWYFERR